MKSMKSSIKFTRLDGLEDIDIETIPLNRNSIFRQNSLARNSLLCVLLTAIIILTVTLFTITLVVVLTLDSHNTAPDDYVCNTAETPPLIVVSLDGFRPDYLDSGLVPTLYKLAEEGVRADYLMGQFPTKTFPNHFTLATGLHPAWHGIVDNLFYDKRLNKSFKISSKDVNNPEWWLGIPIWKKARDEGLKTAAYYWPGSEVSSMLPDYYFPYKSGTKLSTQLRQVDSWLQLPALDRPKLIMLYSFQPDHASHSHGYYSVAMNESLRGIDAALEKFLSNSSVWNCVDKIFVSDHGFANVSLSKILYLEDILNLTLIYPVLSGPVITFNVINQSEVDTVLNTIRSNPNHGITFDAYKGTGLPPRMHYGFTLRYCDIVVLNRVGWLMLFSRGNFKQAGTHGWDNHARDMRGLFIAQGPSFKRNYTMRAFENIHVYNLLSTLLRVKPGSNNGSAGALNDVISEDFKGNLSAPDTSSFSPDSEVQCRFPSLEVLMERVFCNECLCDSCNKTQLTIEYLLKLNLTEEEIVEVKNEFIPGGLPKGGGGNEYCYLANGDSLIKYSSKLKAPVWTAFMIAPDAIPSERIGSCPHINDPRLPHEASLCSDYKENNTTYSIASILPQASLTSATLALKSLPKFLLNQTISRLLSTGSTSYVVVTGAAFLSPTTGERLPAEEWTDWIGNGTIAIPSHVYQIMIPCSKTESKCELITRGIAGYIVENTDRIINPASIETAYQLRMSTIREIERVSGVDFFPDLSLKQQLEIELELETGFDD